MEMRLLKLYPAGIPALQKTNPFCKKPTQKNRVLSMQFFVLKVNQISLK
jgi:hypothetical protein